MILVNKATGTKIFCDKCRKLITDTPVDDGKTQYHVGCATDTIVAEAISKAFIKGNGLWFEFGENK